MTDKNIQIQDAQGNNLFPKTKGAVVINNNGDNLGGVEAGAQANKIEKIKLRGVEVAIATKVVDLPVYTKDETDTAIATAVAGASHLKREIVASLPEVADADANTIYMVLKASGKNGNKYDEFFLINGEFEKIGDTEVSLAGYATEAWVGQQGFLTSHQDISGKANASDVYTKSQVYTKTEADGKFLTSHQDISGKADKATTLSGYGITDAYTKTQADAKFLTEHQDISGKANASDVYTKTQIDNMNLLSYVELA